MKNICNQNNDRLKMKREKKIWSENVIVISIHIVGVMILSAQHDMDIYVIFFCLSFTRILYLFILTIACLYANEKKRERKEKQR